MKDQYLKGEEKFGPVTSFFYSLFTKPLGVDKLYNFIIEDLEKNGSNNLLDVGTGPGDVPVMLATNGKINEIYAIDPSQDMIRIAQSKSKGLKIKYELGSSRHVPFKRKFGVIISALSFHHWAQKPKALKYLSRFLSKNGEIRIYEYEREEISGIRRYFVSSHSVTKKQMLDAAKESGLRIKSMLQKDGIIRTTFIAK